MLVSEKGMWLSIKGDMFDQVIIIMNGFPDSESENKFE